MNSKVALYEFTKPTEASNGRFTIRRLCGLGLLAVPSGMSGTTYRLSNTRLSTDLLIYLACGTLMGTLLFLCNGWHFLPFLRKIALHYTNPLTIAGACRDNNLLHSDK